METEPAFVERPIRISGSEPRKYGSLAKAAKFSINNVSTKDGISERIDIYIIIGASVVVCKINL